MYSVQPFLGCKTVSNPFESCSDAIMIWIVRYGTPLIFSTYIVIIIIIPLSATLPSTILVTGCLLVFKQHELTSSTCGTGTAYASGTFVYPGLFNCVLDAELF